MKKEFPEIKTMGYKAALEYVYCNSGNPKKSKYAIISIQEPTNGYGFGLAFKEGGNCLAALNIEFSDCTPALKIPGTKLMKMEDAKKIHDFVDSIPNEVELLIIHCQYGQSRSVAVAAAIHFAKLGIELYEIDKIANKYVYYQMLETYGHDNCYWNDWYEKEKEYLKPFPHDEILEKLSKISIV